MKNELKIPDTILKLEELLDQGQFELMSDEVTDGKLKVVYLMNDAVESFLVFHQARITGVYQTEFEGEAEGSLTIQKNSDTGNEEFVLVVYQGDSVCTIFFTDITLEVHLYDYGCVGHSWKWLTKRIADMLHKNAHAEVIDLLTEKLKNAASDYPKRKFEQIEEQEHKLLLERAREEQMKLEEQGIKAEILREEPFLASRDSLEYKVYLMIWESETGNRTVKVKEINKM